MKKQLTIALGVLLTLGTAVSATLNDEAQQPKAAAESTMAQMEAKQSAQIVALWKTHATSSGSVPLARPL
jgi:hypothetical protein